MIKGLKKSQIVYLFSLFIITFVTTNTVCSQNLEISFCNDDGYATFNIEELEEYALQTVGTENDYFLEQILISTSTGKVLSVNSPSNNPNVSTLCENYYSSGGYTDIAVDSNQQIFLCAGTIYSLENDCDLFRYNYSYFQSNALSFDDLDNLYLGLGTESYVLRINISPTGVFSSVHWHDFITGASGGDFVILKDKMYISWRLARDNYRLYEVTINENRDYISHIDLGQLPNETYGLASELGKLYGVTPNKLFEIDLSNFTFKDIIQNPNPNDEWYGAAGLHEAVVFKTSTHLTLNDAEKGLKVINGDWTNTVQGGQTIYVRIENSLTKTYDIFNIKINIPQYPKIDLPLDLEKCYDSTYNVFDLSQVSTQMQIDSNQNLSFTYYDKNPENLDTSPQLPMLYQSTKQIETLYVNVENLDGGCSSIYGFHVINNETPNLLPFSNFQSPNFLESCYFDKQNKGYFKLSDIEYDMILGEKSNLEIDYYLSYKEAENNNNQISEIHYLEQPIEEIFIKVTDENDCFTISNFYLNIDCILNNESLSNIFFPKFITPNNDGINDFWNIEGVSEKVRRESTITIFNRYGKEIISFIPNSIEGWNGTYNGNQLPSSDYWFMFRTESGFEKLGHFTLKR